MIREDIYQNTLKFILGKIMNEKDIKSAEQIIKEEILLSERQELEDREYPGKPKTEIGNLPRGTVFINRTHDHLQSEIEGFIEDKNRRVDIYGDNRSVYRIPYENITYIKFAKKW